MPKSRELEFSGRLEVSDSDWGKLSVPQAIVRGLYSAVDAPGIEMPEYAAHISVFTSDEVRKLGGKSAIKERGRSFRFRLGRTRWVNPAGWDEADRVYFVQCRSPELERLRKSYGLSPRLYGSHPFHITFGVRRKSSNFERAQKSSALSPETSQRILGGLAGAGVGAGLGALVDRLRTAPDGRQYATPGQYAKREKRRLATVLGALAGGAAGYGLTPELVQRLADRLQTSKNQRETSQDTGSVPNTDVSHVQPESVPETPDDRQARLMANWDALRGSPDVGPLVGATPEQVYRTRPASLSEGLRQSENPLTVMTGRALTPGAASILRKSEDPWDVMRGRGLQSAGANARTTLSAFDAPFRAALDAASAQRDAQSARVQDVVRGTRGEQAAEAYAQAANAQAVRDINDNYNFLDAYGASEPVYSALFSLPAAVRAALTPGVGTTLGRAAAGAYGPLASGVKKLVLAPVGAVAYGQAGKQALDSVRDPSWVGRTLDQTEIDELAASRAPWRTRIEAGLSQPFTTAMRGITRLQSALPARMEAQEANKATAASKSLYGQRMVRNIVNGWRQGKYTPEDVQQRFARLEAMDPGIRKFTQYASRVMNEQRTGGDLNALNTAAGENMGGWLVPPPR